MEYFVGIDVGSYSARAGMFTSTGELVAMCKRSIQMHQPLAEHYEQSSEDIWQAICFCVQEALKQAKVKIPGFSHDQVKGHWHGRNMLAGSARILQPTSPVSLSTTGDQRWNIIVWCDHRAKHEAELINASGRNVLKYVGGKVSVEMELPKIAWVKSHFAKAGRDEDWARAEFFDLPDYLSFRATGCKARSNCSLACKWLFTPAQPDAAQDGVGWDERVFAAAGLGRYCPATGLAKIGGCLSDSTLTVLKAGLAPGTPVGASVIDAYAGWFGTIASGSSDDKLDRSNQELAGQRLAIIAGTSACHLLASRKPVLVPGVWGPYYSVGLSGWYMLEGGQSAVGSLIDYVVRSHSAYGPLARQSEETGKSVYEILDSMLTGLAVACTPSNGVPESHLVKLVKSLHFLPDHHGNRAPLADPSMRGSIVGETLTHPDSIEALAARYLACICGLAYGTRAILDSAVAAGGQRVTELLISGGLSQGAVFTQILADVTWRPGGGSAPSQSRRTIRRILWNAMAAMTGDGSVIRPTTDAGVLDIHERKYRVMLEMQQDQLKYRRMMQAE
ncbi:Pentulose kinase [Linderina pennispora]|uniref:Pentulose kinase n=1 Tax=Linderina pennispora TaxID=61395 RepID=A0A1Y1WM62_9FUNG|nr:Pentulose kinase [Linderina pennispora]ORX74455.1 Pentulose kinase [Linderina pennispora]